MILTCNGLIVILNQLNISSISQFSFLVWQIYIDIMYMKSSFRSSKIWVQKGAETNKLRTSTRLLLVFPVSLTHDTLLPPFLPLSRVYPFFTIGHLFRPTVSSPLSECPGNSSGTWVLVPSFSTCIHVAPSRLWSLKERDCCVWHMTGAEKHPTSYLYGDLNYRLKRNAIHTSHWASINA